MEMSIGLITTKSFAVDQSVGFLSKIIRRISWGKTLSKVEVQEMENLSIFVGELLMERLYLENITFQQAVAMLPVAEKKYALRIHMHSSNGTNNISGTLYRPFEFGYFDAFKKFRI